jgi:hypothetical protein
MLADELDRPVRLAVLFDENVEAGGGYQQALNACILAARLPSELCTPRFSVTSHCREGGHDYEASVVAPDQRFYVGYNCGISTP